MTSHAEALQAGAKPKKPRKKPKKRHTKRLRRRSIWERLMADDDG